MTDLYAALNAPRDAPKDEIRRAYRRAAKKAHPDGGGTRESFALVRTAVDTLTDDDRRAHYDATGQIGEKPVDQRDALAMTIALNAIDRVLGEIAKRRADPAHFDVVADAITGLSQELRVIIEKIANTKVAADQTRKLAKRFKAKKGKANRIEQMFLARADEMDRNAAKGREEKQNVERALELLREHTFETESAMSRSPGGVHMGGYVMRF